VAAFAQTPSPHRNLSPAPIFLSSSMPHNLFIHKKIILEGNFTRFVKMEREAQREVQRKEAGTAPKKSQTAVS
jgi:hypothetical protein